MQPKETIKAMKARGFVYYPVRGEDYFLNLSTLQKKQDELPETLSLMSLGKISALYDINEYTIKMNGSSKTIEVVAEDSVSSIPLFFENTTFEIVTPAIFVKAAKGTVDLTDFYFTAEYPPAFIWSFINQAETIRVGKSLDVYEDLSELFVNCKAQEIDLTDFEGLNTCKAFHFISYCHNLRTLKCDNLKFPNIPKDERIIFSCPNFTQNTPITKSNLFN